MRSITLHVAVAATIGALSLPAFADDERSAPKQDCSVCDDPTWPEIQRPMPAIALRSDAGAADRVVQIDPTWPELRNPMPAIALRPDGTGEPADVQTDPTWPEMESAAPALAVKAPPTPEERRVVSR